MVLAMGWAQIWATLVAVVAVVAVAAVVAALVGCEPRKMWYKLGGRWY